MVGNICFIRSNSVNPDSRVEKEAQVLMRVGYHVHILAWDRESNHKPEQSVIYKQIGITRIGFKSGYGEGIKSLKSRIEFQIAMIAWLLKNGRKFDAIHSCDADTAIFSYFPARLVGCKFIFDIFDFIYAEPHNFFQWFVKRCQIWLINHADATIICSEQRREQIKEARPKKLSVIHNSPDDKWQKESLPISVNSNFFSVVYVGTLPRCRLIAETMRYFMSHSRCDFYIGGFGPMENEIEKASQNYSNIHFIGRLSYEQTLELERQCDIMTATYDVKIENHRMAAPNKFYESLMLGKPIIMVRGMGMSEEVEKEDIGVLIEYSEEGFKDGLEKLVARKDEWSEMGIRARKLYDTKYSWNAMGERLISLYRSLIDYDI